MKPNGAGCAHDATDERRPCPVHGLRGCPAPQDPPADGATLAPTLSRPPESGPARLAAELRALAASSPDPAPLLAAAAVLDRAPASPGRLRAALADQRPASGGRAS